MAADTMSHSLAGAEHLELRGDGVRLHAVALGHGEPVLLLHGFPDFWYGWRRQLPALANAGFRAVALDMRGYNHSEKPRGVHSYSVSRLVADTSSVIARLGGRAHLVGHDWGGVVAWHMGARHPELLRSLSVMNAPHPARFARALLQPRQFRRSSYACFFQLPWLPERLLSARGHAALLRTLRRSAHAASFTDGDLDAYRAAVEQPGALSAAINYYRAAARGLRLWRGGVGHTRVPTPTLLLWGVDDPFLGLELTEGLQRWVPELTVERIGGAGHWVQLDAAARVNERLISFLRQRSG